MYKRQAHPEEITPDSPTQRIGGKILEGFQPYSHEVPLESLQDVFSAGEVAEFCQRMDESLGSMVEYSVEPKVDGLSVALEYRDGVFVRGAKMCIRDRYQALRQKKRHGQLSEEEKKRQVKNMVLFVLCLLAVYGLGFASIRCFR